MTRGEWLLASVSLILFLGSCGGGGGGSSSGSESTGVAPPSNSQPAFSSSSSFSVVENNAAAGIIEADDADSNDTLALSIEGGEDADLFELGICNASRCTSNSLSFKTAPNFEAPGDATGDNVYEVTLRAYDGTVTVTQDVSVTVTNAIEGRVVDAPLSRASMCVDQDEDWECDVQPDDVDCATVFPPEDNCFTEKTGTSDNQGYYSVAEGVQFPDQELRILSIGGTDILTNKELPSLALIAEIPTDASQAIAVTPLSTVVSIATDPAATLVALGFPETVTPDQITSIDPWALATDSIELSGEFASSAALAESVGIPTTELETVADNVVTTSVQIANLVQTADALVTDTTTSGVQSAAERAAMMSSTVTRELVETIDAAIASAGSAAAASVDLGDAIVTNEVLKETAEESATLIVAEIEAKQTAGTLDLSDTNDATVSEILQIKETQEIITQIGLDSSQTENIAAISDALAETNAFVGSQVATSGIAVLTTASSAGELAEIITNTSTLVGQLVAGEITTENFASSADINTQASSNDGFNDSVAQFTDSDGDGVFDADDAFPNDVSETVDSDGDGVGDNADVFPNDGSETLDSDGDGVGDNADAFPSIASTANPNASTTRLISEGFNQPKTNPGQSQIFSTDTSSYYINRAKAVQRLLNQSFGGYMNYNLLIYEEEGPDEVNQPVIDRLVALNYKGKENWSTEEMEQCCLCSAGRGDAQAGDWVFHSICLWHNSRWFNAPSNPPPDFSKPAGVHEYDITGAMANEYFHHYQRVHGLDRGMDYQGCRECDPYVTVNSPEWWIQGTAMIIQTWWQRGILDELQYLSDEDRADFKKSIDYRMEKHSYRYWMGLQMMQSSRPWIDRYGDIDERFGTSNCSDWLLEEKHYAYGEEDRALPGDCIAIGEMYMVPVHFMAYKSSWEVVLKKIPESYYEYGFWGAVEIHLGLKEQEFYDEFNTFMRAQDWETIEVFYAPEGWNIPDGRIEDHVNFLDIDPYDGQ